MTFGIRFSPWQACFQVLQQYLHPRPSNMGILAYLHFFSFSFFFFLFFAFLFFSFSFHIQYEVPSRGTANQLYLKELDRIVLKAQTTLRSFANSGTVRKTVSFFYLFICILILLFLFYFNIYIYYIKQKLQLNKDCCIPSTCNYRVFVFSNRQECHLHLC